MGMLATVINSLALETAIMNIGGKAKVFTSIRMEPVGEYYCREKVLMALENKVVCIPAGGTGNPFFTTDTAAALRAVETRADVLLKGTRLMEYTPPILKRIKQLLSITRYHLMK